MTSDNPLAYLHRRCDTIAEDNARAAAAMQHITKRRTCLSPALCDHGERCPPDCAIGWSQMPAREPRLWDPSASNAVHAFSHRRKRKAWRETVAVFAVLFFAVLSAFEFIRTLVL